MKIPITSFPRVLIKKSHTYKRNRVDFAYK